MIGLQYNPYKILHNIEYLDQILFNSTDSKTGEKQTIRDQLDNWQQQIKAYKIMTNHILIMKSAHTVDFPEKCTPFMSHSDLLVG